MQIIKLNSDKEWSTSEIITEVKRKSASAPIHLLYILTLKSH